jgi:hypothetical protein
MSNETQGIKEVIVKDEADLKSRIDSGDMEAVNAILTNQVRVIKEDAPVVNVDVSVLPDGSNEEIVAPKVDPEVENLRRRLEFEQSKKQEELNFIVNEKIEKERLLNEEVRKREELEKRLQELDKLQRSTSVETATQTTEDEEFASEYAKQTRRELETLKQQMTAESPVVNQLNERLKKFDELEAERKSQAKKAEDDRKQEEQRKKRLQEITAFAVQHPEFQTKEDFDSVVKEFGSFKNNLAYLNKKFDVDEIDALVMDYFDPNKGAQLREEAAKHGITPPKEAEQFLKTIEVLNFKNGITYDPSLRRFVQDTDEHGNPVHRKSLEEAYLIKNYNSQINAERERAFKTIKNKLDTVQNTPRTLSNSQTSAAPSTEMNETRIKELINLDPNVVRKNPELQREVSDAYRLLGMAPPNFSKRRF